MEQEVKLERKLNPLNVWALALGSIIGWGAFVMPGTTFLPKAGVLGTLIGISIAALIMITIALNYGYMVEKYPEDMIVNLDLLTYAGNLETCKPVEDKPNYKFYRGDIADREFIFDLFEKEKFDMVVNFAAESHVDRSIEDPEVFVRTNVVGTTTLLEYEYNELVVLPGAPDKVGYTYNGWSINGEYAGFVTEFKMPASNLTMTCEYTINRYEEFLLNRRKMMAKKIEEYYKSL